MTLFSGFDRSLRLVALSLPLALQTMVKPVAYGDINSKFIGDWTGTLEYRDYQTNKRVLLPTWLAVTVSTDRRALDFSYVYDDGPTKTVREHVDVAFDTSSNKASLIDHDETSGDKTTTSVYRVTGLGDFDKAGKRTLILDGLGTDNDNAVDVRITIVLERNLLTWRKDVRRVGAAASESFEFRDGYVFTRAQAP